MNAEGRAKRDAELLRLWAETRLTQREIGSRLGISVTSVQRILRTNGGPKRATRADEARRRREQRAKRDAALVARYIAGIPRSALVAEFAISSGAIDAARQRLGVAPLTASQAPDAIEQRAAYVATHWQDDSANRIAADLGVHIRTVRRIARRLGLPHRPTGRPRKRDA